MKNSSAIKIILCIFAVVFLVHQGYSAFYKPIKTESAEYFEAVDGVSISGYIIRTETAVNYSDKGTLHFVTKDGERVAKNGVIAEIYNDSSASVTMSKIAETEKNIHSIEEMMSFNGVQAADLDLINNKVSTAVDNLIEGTSGGNYSAAADDTAEVVAAISRKQMVVGESADMTGRLDDLKSELEALKATLPNSGGSVAADSAGYFVTGLDGFENVLTPAKISEINPEFLSSLKKGQVSTDAIGKIVADGQWYIAAKMTINESLKFKEGEDFSMKTPLKSNPYLPVTVAKINLSENSDSAVVVFSCRVMTPEIAKMRTARMTVIRDAYSGLKISKKALRVVDKQTGVYVLSGISLKFVPVEVVYSTDQYILCKQVKSNENVLRLYDEVVVKGKNLKDGKIVG